MVDLEFGLSAFIHVDSGMISIVFLAVVVANTICILILDNVFYHSNNYMQRTCSTF